MRQICLTRTLMSFAILAISFGARAQFSQNEQKQLVIGTVDSMYSEAMDEQRGFWVHLPEKLDSTKRYPVIYLLDATAHFHTATGLLKLLTEWNMPESILVGIDTSNDRIGDLTPSNVPFHRGHNSETSGRAPALVKFIHKELQPYINSTYPTENISTIIGHSTGGLFVIYSYVNHPEVFDNYLAIDPSLWWDKEIVVNQGSELINPDHNHSNKRLYMAIAGSDEKDTVAVRNDTSVATEQIRANLNFHDILLSYGNHLDYRWDYYDDESHGSVVVPAMYNGLRSLFSWFPFPEMWRFNTPDQYTAKELTQPFYAHFSELSRRLKRKVKPDWQLVNDVGFYMLSGFDFPEKALAYLEMNLDFYPDYSKSYEALGDFYVMQDDKNKAINYYKKAIELDGNEEAKTKLAKLD